MYSKRIISRNLPLNTQYTVIDKKYIPLEESFGTCCDNCGKLIANIATVRSNSGVYNIGFDCLETILINNNLLSENDIKDYERVKKMIPKAIRFAKHLKELIDINNGLNGFKFERPTWNQWVTFWILKENKKPYNSGLKVKDLDFDFLITTIKAILPKHKIEVI